jgi:hypothetical protein
MTKMERNSGYGFSNMNNISVEILYQRALRKSWKRKIWSMITGRSHELHNLQGIPDEQVKHRYSEPGIQTVQIAQIQGSDGRTRDFDRDFNPMQTHTRERWQSIARLHMQGRSLPPIDLVQVGDRYYVQDGHHRVSVARSFGQLGIEANVIRMQIADSAVQKLDKENKPRWTSDRLPTLGRLSSWTRGKHQRQVREQPVIQRQVKCVHWTSC